MRKFARRSGSLDFIGFAVPKKPGCAGISADTRNDFLHQTSTRIVRDNQAICVEDLAVKNMAVRWLPTIITSANWSAQLFLPKCPSSAQAFSGHVGRVKPLKTLTLKGMCPSAQVFLAGRDLCCGENKKNKKAAAVGQGQNHQKCQRKLGKAERWFILLIEWIFLWVSLYK